MKRTRGRRRNGNPRSSGLNIFVGEVEVSRAAHPIIRLQRARRANRWQVFQMGHVTR